MALPNLILYRRANAPAVRIVLEDVDLTGSTVQLDVTPKTTGVTTTFATGGAGLTISGTNTVIWTYSEDDAEALPLGDWTAFDIYRLIGETREKIGAGTVRVNGVGGFEQQAPVFVEVPGVQGPKGDTGDTGPQGAQGIKGDTGAQGPQGIQGVQGPQGGQGPQGSTGPQGIQGVPGPTVAPTLVIAEASSFTYATATHLNRIVSLTSATAQTITLPSGPAVGEGIAVVQWGDGRWQFIAGANAQVHHEMGWSKTSRQNALAYATVIEVAGGVTHWLIAGSVEG